eukprot:CAMPEP_0184740734 /NCGR_PEP_ID=MMETSP0315-20130426/3751_1 /TAXON_ID=101924 /ORGANISM="Rhodosorus marinus, Strain UTEX LB 2760" /LENGTH=192 /DNA_ID=CAMNT_0027210595 /DNA_START=156 /DNA_END=734 /DNA_ORIENTATION=-
MDGRSVALLLFLALGVWSESTEDSVGVLFFQRDFPEKVVEGDVVNVTYTLVNVGNGAVYSLSTSDSALVKHKALKLTSGTPKKEKSILEAGESTTFSLEAKTIKAGDFMISPAEVEYASSLTEEAEIRRGFSTLTNYIEIESLEAYKKRTDLHLDVLGVFALLASLLTIAPLALYFSTSSSLKVPSVVKKTQ